MEQQIILHPKLQNKSQEKSKSRKHLPLGILQKIFFFLDAKSLCICSQVCRYFHHIIDDYRLWNELLYSQYRMKLCGFRRPVPTAKKIVISLQRGIQTVS